MGGQRGRGRGGGGRRGGFFTGGRGRGRGGGKRPHSNNSKEARHLQSFGEAHPSAEMGDFGPSSSKTPKHSGNLRGRGGRGRGFGQGQHRGGRNGRGAAESSSSEESEAEEQTPYNELLSLFKKKKGAKEQVQILSDDEEEEELSEEEDEIVQEEVDDEEEVEEVGNSEEITGEDGSVVEEQEGKENVDDEEDEEENAVAADEEPVIEEAELNPEMEEESTETTTDPFLLHLEREMPDCLLSRLKDDKIPKKQFPFVWPQLDKFTFYGLDSVDINDQILRDRNLRNSRIDVSLGATQPIIIPSPPGKSPTKNTSLESFHIKPQLVSTFPIVNQKVIDSAAGCRDQLDPLQKEILEFSSNYMDGYFPIRTLENEEAIRNVYCLHVANHILKTRTRILHHNAKMVNRIDVPDAYRDQGFVRPKVLILVPFKSSALKIVQTLISILLPEEKGNVANKKRFLEDYGGTTLFLPKTNPKPDDYNATFSGNVEDNFKLGLSLTKKTIKLYTGFYSSDIIIASPLGLRMIIGAEGEKNRDYDFLSSIELLILDQADIFLMQNWDHILHIMRHLHLQPVTTHGTDFARIRSWALDGLSKYFNQTLIFSSTYCPEHSSLMSKYCQNYAGQIRQLRQFSRGSINDVTVQLPQVFQYFESTSLQSADDDRFNFFIKTVLPSFTDKLMSHTMIFVSSYFDFVRLRNYFKREQSSFVQICEYTKDKKIARARDYFFHGQGHFLLYTERVHFFRRFRLKGVGHILFYQLPQYPHFYSELCNSIREDFQNRRVRTRKNASVNVMYCKYDAPRLAAVVGSERAGQMLSSDKNVHAFVSGDL